MLNANAWGTRLLLRLCTATSSGRPWRPIVKDKTFFFASYSSLRQNTSTFLNGALVPSALERNGDFSSRRSSRFNPATHLPYPGNVIYATRTLWP